VRFGRVLALVAAGLALCFAVLIAAVVLTRDKARPQSDILVSENLTKAVTTTQDPENGTHGVVRLADVAPFDWDRVLLIAPGTSRAEISRRLGEQWTGIDTIDGGEVLIFLRDGKVVRFADYRGNGRFAGFPRPFAELPRSRAVFVVRDLVIRLRA
jgi:hypothetical protein